MKEADSPSVGRDRDVHEAILDEGLLEAELATRKCTSNALNALASSAQARAVVYGTSVDTEMDRASLDLVTREFPRADGDSLFEAAPSNGSRCLVYANGGETTSEDIGWSRIHAEFQTKIYELGGLGYVVSPKKEKANA